MSDFPTHNDDHRLHDWYHTIDLKNGLFSKGVYDHRPIVPLWGLPDSLAGMSALDIGTFDGFWAFELEARGADRVVTLDIAHWEELDWQPHVLLYKQDVLAEGPSKNFHIARRMRASGVEPIVGNIYTLSPETIGTFDIVVCGSLLLHLRDPLRALTNIRRVTGRSAYIETTIEAYFDQYHSDQPYVRFGNIDYEDVPGLECAYWRFSSRALHDMLTYAGFEDIEMRPAYRAPYAQPNPHAVMHRVFIAQTHGKPYPSKLESRRNPLSQPSRPLKEKIQGARNLLQQLQAQPVEGRMTRIKGVAYRLMHSTLYRLYTLHEQTFDLMEQLHEDIGAAQATEFNISYEVFDPQRPLALEPVIERILNAPDVRSRTFSGYCNLNNEATSFRITDDNLRENVLANTTRSQNRQRQLVCALSIVLFGDPYHALPQIAQHINDHRLSTYIAESTTILYAWLSRYIAPDLLVSSEYFSSEHISGAVVNGIRHEDLAHTSFANESMDIVIVCDVLEHVPDVTQVEREIVRILKKGGHFLQTLPLDIFAEHDVVLARLGQNGIEHLTDQPEYHIDNFHPEQGALVFRRFSYADIHQRFSSLGCEHRAYSFASRQLGIIGINPPVHIVRKIESVV